MSPLFMLSITSTLKPNLALKTVVKNELTKCMVANSHSQVQHLRDRGRGLASSLRPV